MVRMSSAMWDCATFTPLISPRRCWERAMAYKRGVVGVSTSGVSLRSGTFTLLWSAQGRGAAQGTDGSTYCSPHPQQPRKGSSSLETPQPCPSWGRGGVGGCGGHCTI